jgi:GMP synthase-like glutamine amidotransferase
VQWHFDTVSVLPDGATLLASSDRYDVQAFRVGEVAWGLQFHVEATTAMVADWAANDAEAIRASSGRTPQEVMDELAAAQFRVLSGGRAVIDRFATVITG